MIVFLGLELKLVRLCVIGLYWHTPGLRLAILVFLNVHVCVLIIATEINEGGLDETWHAYRISVGEPEGTDRLEDLDVRERIILRVI